MTIEPEVQCISSQSFRECTASELVMCTASKRKDFEIVIYHHQISILGLQNVTNLCLEKQYMIGYLASIQDRQVKLLS